MKFVKISFVLAALMMALLGCSTAPKTENSTANTTKPAVNTATPQPSPTADELASARKNYKDKNCVKCHKEDGTGGEIDIEGTKIKVPDFKSDKMKNIKDEIFIDVITNGEDDMPAFKGKLTPDEIKDLVKLIRKDFQGK